jgi:undecaprenyl-diphosphatase
VTLWFAILLGVVQGLTEFLPISSTAHLRVVPALLGQPDPGAAFTAVVQLGTLLAVIGYFVKELAGMARAAVTAPRSPEARHFWYIGLGTVPIGLAGLLGKRWITGELRSLVVVATALIVVGVLMGWVDRRSQGTRTTAQLTLRDALLIGVGQALALVPGVSRAGATITTALLLGYTRPDAARWSFLLAVPAIGAAGLYELPDALRELGPGAGWPLVVSTLVAGVTGYLSIAWLLRHLRTRSLAGFAVYRVVVGALILILLALGRIAD